MNLIEASLFILLLAAISVPLAKRFQTPLEIFLLTGSCFLSLLPGLSVFELDPNLVFSLFLPPILFYAAYFTSWRDVNRNRRPIALLAVALVLLTAAAVAYVAHTLFPELEWGEGFLLGAIIAPPDASAATSIVKKLRAPRGLVTILEGESLFNDATALVTFRFALAAVVIGSFSLIHALGQFLLMGLGGALIGFLMTLFFFQILKRVQDSQAQVILTIVAAFSSYIVAEHFQVSGVISTVISGFFFSRKFPSITTSQTRMQTRATWQTLIFIINSFVFTLLGFQLPQVLQQIRNPFDNEMLIKAVTIAFIVIGVRLIWVYTATYLPRVLNPAFRRRHHWPSWKILFALAWTGMRGIVSLAAVLAIPTHLPSGAVFPHRGILLFVTYVVIMVTLLLPALTLPTLFKLLRLKTGSAPLQEEALARLRSLEGVLHKISHWETRNNFPAHLVADFRKQIERRIETLRPQLQSKSFSPTNEEYLAIRWMNREAIESERGILMHLRQEGKIHDDIFHLLSEELDLEEMRSKTLRV